MLGVSSLSLRGVVAVDREQAITASHALIKGSFRALKVNYLVAPG
jgi:hypothetical protein